MKNVNKTEVTSTLVLMIVKVFTWEPEGKLTPSSFRDLMVALMRLSCGSFWKLSAHSIIKAFSLSHTLL